MTTNPKPSVAKDVFVYLLVFVMLYIGVINFIGLLWEIIGAQFPDSAELIWRSPYDSMRNQIAALIVVWPVFLLVSRYLVKDLARHPEKVNLWVRKWLTYLTLFVASLTIIIDLIILINAFLGGELTTRFVLKVVAVLLVAGAALGYEYWELKRKPSEGKKELRIMAWASVVAVILGMVAGFYFVGTPGQARQERFDSERVSDLQSIQSQVVNYWNQKDVLPENLEDLSDPIEGFSLPADPDTGAAYEYVLKDELTFELCATFGAETPEWERNSEKVPFMLDEFGFEAGGDWVHEAGRVCFERSIDPDRHATSKPVR